MHEVLSWPPPTLRRVALWQPSAQANEEFDNRLDPHEVDQSLDRVIAQFTDVKVQAFVPLLVRRYVRAELYSRL